MEPELVVLPRALLLPEDAERSDEGRTLRLDRGDPVPELVVEILSPSIEGRDMRQKMILYADLGIAEYWVCDPGGQPEPGSPARLRVHRRQPDGRYAPDPEADAYLSDVCDTHVRLWQPDPGRPPRFQRWDPEQNRWRDARESRTETLIDTMHAQLAGKLEPAARDAIAANWQRFGLPDDAPLRILDVRETPGSWPNLLKPDPDVRAERDDCRPP